MLEILLYRALRLQLLKRLPCLEDLDRWVQKRIDGRLYLASYLDGAMWVCPVYRMDQTIFDGGIYEPTIIEIIQKFSSEGFSFVDVGANIGLHTVAAALRRKNEEQKFFAFEPEANCFSTLKKNCVLNNISFVTCEQIGIGNSDGFIQLNISTTRNKGNHSFLSRNGTKPGQKVRMITLDKLFLSKFPKVHTPILIKVDVEGFEFLVVQGGYQWLSQLEETAMICEVSPCLLSSYSKRVKDLIEFLQRVGFNQHKVIVDEETFTETGKRRKPFFNIISWKGDITQKVLSIINQEKMIDLDNIL